MLKEYMHQLNPQEKKDICMKLNVSVHFAVNLTRHDSKWFIELKIECLQKKTIY